MQDVTPSVGTPVATGNVSSAQNLSNDVEEFISVNGEDILVIHSHDLTEISLFGQLYLIRKVLGESMPLKTILSKCLNVWKFCWGGYHG